MEERYNNEFIDKDPDLLQMQCKGAFRFEQIQYVGNLILDLEQEYMQEHNCQLMLKLLSNKIEDASPILTKKKKQELIEEIEKIREVLPLHGYPYTPIARLRRNTYETAVNVMASTKEYHRSIKNGTSD